MKSHKTTRQEGAKHPSPHRNTSEDGPTPTPPHPTPRRLLTRCVCGAGRPFWSTASAGWSQRLDYCVGGLYVRVLFFSVGHGRGKGGRERERERYHIHACARAREREVGGGQKGERSQRPKMTTISVSVLTTPVPTDTHPHLFPSPKPVPITWCHCHLCAFVVSLQFQHAGGDTSGSVGREEENKVRKSIILCLFEPPSLPPPNTLPPHNSPTPTHTYLFFADCLCICCLIAVVNTRRRDLSESVVWAHPIKKIALEDAQFFMPARWLK